MDNIIYKLSHFSLAIISVQWSIDSLDTNDEEVRNNFPVEFLSTFNFSGMPSHDLKLKEGAIVVLLKNLNPKMDYVGYAERAVKVMHQISSMLRRWQKSAKICEFSFRESIYRVTHKFTNRFQNGLLKKLPYRFW